MTSAIFAAVLIVVVICFHQNDDLPNATFFLLFAILIRLGMPPYPQRPHSRCDEGAEANNPKRKD